MGGRKCNADDNWHKIRVESLKGEENVLSIINGMVPLGWWPVSLKKKLFPEFIEDTRNFLSSGKKTFSGRTTRGNLGNWFVDENYTHLTFIIVEPSCFAMSLRWSQDALHSLSSFAMFAASSSKSIFEALVTAPIWKQNHIDGAPRKLYSNLRNTRNVV